MQLRVKVSTPCIISYYIEVTQSIVCHTYLNSKVELVSVVKTLQIDCAWKTVSLTFSWMQSCIITHYAAMPSFDRLCVVIL